MEHVNNATAGVTETSSTSGGYVRRELVAGGSAYSVFADGSYTAWVPRSASELAACMA